MGQGVVDKLIIWDFDGTLAYRDGMWGGTLIEILQERLPEIEFSLADLGPYLQSGFPWHTPEVSHKEIQDANAWWEMLTPIFERALMGVGLIDSQAAELASLVPAQFCKPDKWHLFDDTLNTLTDLSRHHWSHVILSNHVPELESIVEALGIASFFERIFTSAKIGFEKPHPGAFRTALEAFPQASNIWMIGDNPVADVKGAEENDIPAILVRTKGENVTRQCDNLQEMKVILGLGLPG